jgi:hypothetical protein
MYIRRRGFGATSTDSGLQTIAATIQQVEGYYPGTLAYTNNNPGNLIYVGQAGASPGAGGFASFPTYDAGYQALLNQIQNYANRGLTIDQMMAIYAPAGQGSNNPSSYANTIANNLGVSTSTPVATAISGAASPSVDSLSSDLTDLTDLTDSTDTAATVDPTLLIVGGLLVGLVAWKLA